MQAAHLTHLIQVNLGLGLNLEGLSTSAISLPSQIYQVLLKSAGAGRGTFTMLLLLGLWWITRGLLIFEQGTHIDVPLPTSYLLIIFVIKDTLSEKGCLVLIWLQIHVKARKLLFSVYFAPQFIQKVDV